VVLLAFALAALALSAVGVYSVVSYAVARRVREMGIRMALGAASNQVVALVVRASMAVAALGVALGLVASLFVGRAMGDMIHGVRPTDPWSIGGSACVLLVCALVAAWVPARRATRADPLDAMRAE
jgi:ABC-type antimicrobial peptide transport system permease subunit